MERRDFDSELDRIYEIIFTSYDKRIDSEYSAALAEVSTDFDQWIGLSDIPQEVVQERLMRLEKKLREYSERVKEKFSESADGVFSGAFVGGLYKRDILRLVLKEGEVNAEALIRVYEKIDMSVNYSRLDNAFRVINDYIRTGGAHTVGGVI